MTGQDWQISMCNMKCSRYSYEYKSHQHEILAKVKLNLQFDESSNIFAREWKA